MMTACRPARHLIRITNKGYILKDLREFAQLVKSANPEKNLSVVFVHRKDEEKPEFSPSSPTPYVLCNDKIKSLGFSPKTTLKDGIKRSIRATELRAELRRIK